MTDLSTRTATPADLDAYLALQRHCWGDLATPEDQARSRFDLHLDGILLAEEAGRAVGAVTLVRLAEYDEHAPKSWSEATGDGWGTTHVPDGPVVFGVDLSVRRPSVGRPLLAAAARFAITEGATALVWGGRMPGYASYHAANPDVDADKYLWMTTPAGRHLDWQVRRCAEALPGVEVLRTIPNYAHDPESLDYGVLLRIRVAAS